MIVDIYATSLEGDRLDSEEAKLYDLITQYRARQGLPSIPLSRALTTVANRHVQDVAENLRITVGDSRNPHSWSWGSFDSNNPATYPNMWEAPQRLNTGYPGIGYENFLRHPSGVINAEEALRSWQSSPPHNDVILNQGVWQNRSWNAIGIGIYQGNAALWFGEELDPTGTPDTSISPTPPSPQSPYILGTEGHDQLQGGMGNDSIFGLGGNDTLRGGAGDDFIHGNQGDDYLWGEMGHDSIRGGKGSDIIFGNDGNDWLYGDLDNDTVYGGTGNDVIYGGKNNDWLEGGPGNDTLFGDLGADTLIGGAGNDVFVLRGDAPDLILDYNDSFDFIGLTGGLSFNNLLISQGIGLNANDTLIQLAGTGQLIAVLAGVNANVLDRSDFISL